MRNIQKISLAFISMLILFSCGNSDTDEAIRNNNYIETQEAFKAYNLRKEPEFKKWDADHPKPTVEQVVEKFSDEFCECVGYVNFDLINNVTDKELREAVRKAIENQEESHIESYSITAILGETCSTYLETKNFVRYGFDYSVLQPKLEEAVNNKCPKFREKQLALTQLDFTNKRLYPIVLEVKESIGKQK